MPGTQIFTRLNWGKETVKGTPVAPTRQVYAEGTGTGTEDLSLNFHEEENSGKRTRIRRVTQQSEDAAIQFRTASGVGYDDLIWPLVCGLRTISPTGAGADRTWTGTPSMTAANSPESSSVDIGDDTQNWRYQYCMFESFKISAALGELTQLEGSLFAQKAVKTAAASPAINSAVKIPGELWTAKFASTMAGLPGASIQTNLLVDFSLEITTGLKWRHYLDGALTGAQHVETDIAATLEFTVESTAFAISEFYDKWKAQTLDFIRLKATGPTLGGSNYSAQIDMPILFSDVPPITKEDEGVNLYTIKANMAYDDTSGSSIVPVVVCSLTAIP